MIFRVFSAVIAALCVWSAYLQLNDPDPLRWVLMYLAGAAVAVVAALGKAIPWLAFVVSFVALAWASAILPEVWNRWRPDDLMATMVPARPEIEYGRELFGLLIVAAYCISAFLVARSAQRSTPAGK
jgi:hypothetical protein